MATINSSREVDRQIYERIVALNDNWVDTLVTRQVQDPESRHYGGIKGEQTGVPSPTHGGTAGNIATFAAALVNPDSRYYHHPALLQVLELAVQYMLNRQHPDGTISLGSTNYNSPPDTGFVVVGLAQVYHVLKGHSWSYVQPAALNVKHFLERAVPAMLTGGCHTPNHRWVMSAALGQLFQIFGLAGLVARADEWLAEGIDCTADGEWSERSNGIYNTVSDVMLYYTAKTLDRPELLDHVRRNLHMMMYLIHPNGEAVTDYSGRQDFGQTVALAEYFVVSRLMAAHDRDPQLASMSDLAGATMARMGPVNNHAMLGYLMFPQIQLQDLHRQPLPEQYVKIINRNHPYQADLLKMQQVGHHSQLQHSAVHTSFGAPIVRCRSGRTSATIMTKAASFFALRHGEANFKGVQLVTSFMPGVVEMETLDQRDGGYRLTSSMEKGYNGPIPAELLPDSARKPVSPWYLLPHQHRPLTHVQQFSMKAHIMPTEAGWRIRIVSDDREDVYAQLLFSFARNGQITGPGVEPLGEGTAFWRHGSVRFAAGSDWIELDGGGQDHIIRTMRGAQAPIDSHTLLVNLLTPFEHTFELRLSR
ncbi:hypothetical protein [Paenibacillus xerothermodurans]|uniref:Alginate lyase domain-containing protein n=1 Tax=Paenibacillus xerothermodurans TaxID=1977292 RepID=A0A2W1NS90_PAEXE|nr:hypothetical protein [Paenibacillus xerothermodurans]PZE21653.1 hypothetical protein CBW46_004315 [Paenibacillus xerothermodurans]